LPDPERLDRVAAELRANRAAAVVCGLPCNILMLTGYWPVVGNSLAIVTSDGDLQLITPSDEEELARRAGVTRITTFEAGSLSDLRTLSEILSPLLQAVVREMGLENAVVAYESDGAFEPASYISMHFFGDGIFEMLENAFKSGSLVAADDLLAHLRAVLTAAELSNVREACRIAGDAFESGARAIAAGQTELEIADAFRRGLSPIRRSGGHVSCMSGPNSERASGAFAISGARAIERGDFVLVHCNSWLEGFWTDITRTWTLGEPDAKQKAVQSAIAEARAAALDSIRPGASASQVDLAARAVMKKHGFEAEFRHGAGHGVGYAAIDHNAQPRIHPKSPDILETGMVFNIEPAAYSPEFGGSRHCDVVAVTRSGFELITDFQADPRSCVLAAAFPAH
jgi:Xaa-Pro aminopeptidase